MENNIFCVKDNEENQMAFFQSNVSLEQYKKDYIDYFRLVHPTVVMRDEPTYWKGEYSDFIAFIKIKGAIPIVIPVLVANSYPDPHYRD